MYIHVVQWVIAGFMRYSFHSIPASMQKYIINTAIKRFIPLTLRYIIYFHYYQTDFISNINKEMSDCDMKIVASILVCCSYLHEIIRLNLLAIILQ